MDRGSQTALEYMMTYGWMAIMIVVAISVLFYLGVFGAASVPPMSISGFPGISVNSAAANTTFFEFSLSNNLGFSANIKNVTVTVNGNSFDNFLCTTPYLFPGQRSECAVLGNFGSSYTGVSVYIDYTVSSSFLSGQSSGLVQLTPTHAPTPYNFPSHAINITITASGNVTAPFQEEIVLNSSEFYPYETADLGNMRFYNGSANNSTELYSWCESGCYSQSNDSIIWVKLNGDLAKHKPVNITLVFERPTNYDGIYAGEAPQLSPTYAEYDNGVNVFSEYWNFAGTSLPSGLSEITGAGGTISFDNKAMITLSSLSWGTYLVTTSQVNDNHVTDADMRQYPTVSKGPTSLAALVVSSTSTLGTTSYADYYAFPSSSASNYFAAVYGYDSNGNGFPFSTLGDTQDGNTNFGVFSLGINSSGDLGFALINYLSQSAASNSEILPSFYIGLQTINGTATYQWLRVRVYPPNGIMPTARVGPPPQTVFTESGLPSGYKWNITYDSIKNSATTPSTTFSTSPGSYPYSVATLSNSSLGCTTTYAPSPSSNSLAAGSTQAITFTGSTVCTTTFTESGLPSGTSWNVTYDGVTDHSATNTITFSETSTNPFSYMIYDQLISSTAGYCYLKTYSVPALFSGSADGGSSVPVTFTNSSGCTLAYVTNYGANTTSVINTSSNAVIGSPIAVGAYPYGIAVTPNGKFAYVTNYIASTVSVINTSSNAVIGSPIAVGADPSGIAVTPNGKFAYVTNEGASTVSIINTSSNAVIGSPIAVGADPIGISLSSVDSI